MKTTPSQKRNGGWALFVTALLIVIGGTAGIIAAKLAQTAKICLPDTAQPDPTWVQSGTNYYSTFIVLIPPVFLAQMPTGFQMVVQYGLDQLGQPWTWVDTKADFPENETPAQQNAVQGETTTSSMNIYYSSGDVWNFSFATGTMAFVGNWTPPNPQGVDVVIQRSHDLKTWTPIFTNTILAGSTWTLVDSNAPLDHAFYRAGR